MFEDIWKRLWKKLREKNKSIENKIYSTNDDETSEEINYIFYYY